MANPDHPFGFRLSRHAWGGNEEKLNEYPIASALGVNIGTGDAVKSDGSGGITLATAGDAVRGVFRGVKYRDSTGAMVYKPNWVSGTVTFNSENATALVNDDPGATFVARADGTINAADIGLFCNLVAGTPSTAGQSRQNVGATGGSQLQLIRFLYLPGPKYNASTGELEGHGYSEAGAYALLEVKFVKHELAGSAAGISV